MNLTAVLLHLQVEPLIGCFILGANCYDVVKVQVVGQQAMSIIQFLVCRVGVLQSTADQEVQRKVERVKHNHGQAMAKTPRFKAKPSKVTANFTRVAAKVVFGNFGSQNRLGRAKHPQNGKIRPKKPLVLRGIKFGDKSVQVSLLCSISSEVLFGFVHSSYKKRSSFVQVSFKFRSVSFKFRSSFVQFRSVSFKFRSVSFSFVQVSFKFRSSFVQVSFSFVQFRSSFVQFRSSFVQLRSVSLLDLGSDRW